MMVEGVSKNIIYIHPDGYFIYNNLRIYEDYHRALQQNVIKKDVLSSNLCIVLVNCPYYMKHSRSTHKYIIQVFICGFQTTIFIPDRVHYESMFRVNRD
jgi:hypothetical protein